MRRPRWLSEALLLTVVVGCVEAVVLLVSYFALPFPHAWLSSGAPHAWANKLRALTAFVGGFTIGMVVFTLARSAATERRVRGSHPRKMLYRYATEIAFWYAFLILATLVYLYDRIGLRLSVATPMALVAFVGSARALALMLSYQRSRLVRDAETQQVIGTVERAGGGVTLLVRVVGSDEPVAVGDWIEAFEGELVRVRMEKVGGTE